MELASKFPIRQPSQDVKPDTNNPEQIAEELNTMRQETFGPMTARVVGVDQIGVRDQEGQ